MHIHPDPFRLATRVAVVCSLALALPWAAAVDRGTAPAGAKYLSGGIGLDEQADLRQELSGYTLWLTTAARGSGEYLASVKLRISEAASGQLVLVHTMAGPWFFAALPAGRYQVEATASRGAELAPLTQRLTVSVGGGGAPQQHVIEFAGMPPAGPGPVQPR